MSRFALQKLTFPSLLLAAFLLRAGMPGHMAIEHFDEGVYASNLFSDHLNYSYPDREFYAPPLLPAIFEWVLILCGGSPHAVMWVNVLLGTALVAAVYWTSRQIQWNTPGSGEVGQTDAGADELAHWSALAAAALVAFSDLFIQYSRAALTDIPVCLGITLAVGAGARGLIRHSWGWSIVSALMTALAWWTKYNGWLPLAILGAGLGGWWLLTPAGRGSFLAPASEKRANSSKQKKRPQANSVHAGRAFRPGLRQLGQWIVIVTVAGLLWLPCLLTLRSQGGYAAIAQNHRGYLVGLSGWLSSVQQQLAVDRYYAGPSSSVGLIIAAVMAAPLADRPGRSFVILTVAILTPWIGLIPGLSLLTLVAIGLSLLSPATASAKVGPPLGLWILLAWIAGLTLSTPLYRPYPRLVLPWMISTCIAAGIGVALLMRRPELIVPDALTESDLKSRSGNEPNSPGDWEWFRSGMKLLLAPAILFVAGALTLTSPASRDDRTGLAQGAELIVEAIRSDLRHQPRSGNPNLEAVIYVIAEPGLYYHLAAHEDEQLKYITQPASDLGMLTSGKVDPRVPAYLVTGLHATKETAELTRLADLHQSVRAVDSVGYLPSSLVLLDEYAPAALPEHRSSALQIWTIRQ